MEKNGKRALASVLKGLLCAVVLTLLLMVGVAALALGLRISDGALQYNFTNEGGVDKTIRFLRNIMGLWLIQECRTEWKRRGKKYTFDELDEFANQAEPFRSFINPNDQSFVAPGDMPALQGPGNSSRRRYAGSYRQPSQRLVHKHQAQILSPGRDP